MQYRLFFIIGMHRSGTSLLTRLCNMAGMGIEAGILVPALPNDNETGFWELQEVVDRNEAIFEHFGFTHLDEKPFSSHWLSEKSVQEHKPALRALVQKGVEQYSLFAIKDPRLCRILPLWLEVCDELAIVPKCIYSVRNPLEVAMSLHKRNHISVEQGLALWQCYNQEALLHTESLPRAFVHFPTIAQQWQNTLRKVSETLEFNWTVPLNEIVEEVDDFIRPDLRHHDFEALISNDARVSCEMVELYDRLKSYCVNAPLPLSSTNKNDLSLLARLFGMKKQE